jgi:hypothetical protein
MERMRESDIIVLVTECKLFVHLCVVCAVLCLPYEFANMMRPNVLVDSNCALVLR